MLQIKDITLENLMDFANSDEYRQMKDIPISMARINSYRNNPRGSGGDAVLFIAYWNNKYVGYLGAMPDIIFVTGEPVKVAWLSCMWVEKEYRRKGVALDLMNHAYKTWKGQLVITNYIPQAKAVYNKTNSYTILKSIDGVRAYLRFDTATLLTRKFRNLQKFKLFFRMSDLILNFICDTRFIFIKKRKRLKEFNIEEISNPDRSINEFIDKYSGNTVSERKAEDFNWLMNYPWVREGKLPDEEQSKYAFTVVCKKFKQLFLKITDKQNNAVAFLVLTHKNKELKTPYLFFQKEYTPVVWEVIRNYMIKNKICNLITFNYELQKFILENRLSFIYKKKAVYSSLISKLLLDKTGLKDSIIMYDGDGDAMFT